MDKYAVCVENSSSIAGHLPLGKNGKFAKMIFYFLRADQDAECKVAITGKEVSLGDGGGMQVPCKLKISGPRNMVEILCKNIHVVQKRTNKMLLLFLYLYIHLLSQQSNALNSLNLNVFENSKAFMIPLVGTFWGFFPTNQRKTSLSIWS